MRKYLLALAILACTAWAGRRDHLIAERKACSFVELAIPTGPAGADEQDVARFHDDILTVQSGEDFLGLDRVCLTHPQRPSLRFSPTTDISKYPASHDPSARPVVHAVVLTFQSVVIAVKLVADMAEAVP